MRNNKNEQQKKENNFSFNTILMNLSRYSLFFSLSQIRSDWDVPIYIFFNMVNNGKTIVNSVWSTLSNSLLAIEEMHISFICSAQPYISDISWSYIFSSSLSFSLAYVHTQRHTNAPDSILCFLLICTQNN